MCSKSYDNYYMETNWLIANLNKILCKLKFIVRIFLLSHDKPILIVINIVVLTIWVLFKCSLEKVSIAHLLETKK